MSLLFGILEILVLISAVGSIAGIILLIVDYKASRFILPIICALVLTISIFANNKIISTDQYRAIDNNNFVTEYARIIDIGENFIVLDNTKWVVSKESSLFDEKYPINLSSFEIGDIVKYHYVDGDFYRFLTSIEESK